MSKFFLQVRKEMVSVVIFVLKLWRFIKLFPFRAWELWIVYQTCSWVFDLQVNSVKRSCSFVYKSARLKERNITKQSSSPLSEVLAFLALMKEIEKITHAEAIC